MKVSEAIELLRHANPNAQVFVSSDEEGNSHREAHFSFPEIMCDQYGEWVACDKEDVERGEYKGWEDSMVPAVVVW